MLVFCTIADFIYAWKMESEASSKIFSSLTERALSQPVYGEGRTLGKLVNHLIGAVTTIPSQAGLPTVPEIPAYTNVPDLIAAYQQVSDNLIKAVETNWTDETLQEEVKMFARFQWRKGFALLFLILHQTHHRGQITVLMRQAGIQVPGIYGPAKEEWEAMNMPTMP
jgi:uncharacterized damage-inducible protein DinB